MSTGPAMQAALATHDSVHARRAGGHTSWHFPRATCFQVSDQCFWRCEAWSNGQGRTALSGMLINRKCTWQSPCMISSPQAWWQLPHSAAGGGGQLSGAGQHRRPAALPVACRAHSTAARGPHPGVQHWWQNLHLHSNTPDSLCERTASMQGISSML